MNGSEADMTARQGCPAGVGAANQITSRNRGHRVQDVIDELNRYVTGWLNYFSLSHTYTELLELDEWVRRRVRLYCWKQWKQPRTRRRHLLALGIREPAGSHLHLSHFCCTDGNRLLT